MAKRGVKGEGGEGQARARSRDLLDAQFGSDTAPRRVAESGPPKARGSAKAIKIRQQSAPGDTDPTIATAT